jgi:hypothetical protein
MPCAGHCFDVAPLEPPPLPGRLSKKDRTSSIWEFIEKYTYSPLKAWQTRILCLHPSESSSTGEQEAPLSADLLVATVSDTEGIVIEQSGDIVEYIALSYTWGYPELSEILICNGKKRMISDSNAAALIALRSSTTKTYVWVDAICINQGDSDEKSAQVARMLSIYKKARSVTAWLGQSDDNSLLAFVCCQELTKLCGAVSGVDRTAHAPACFAQLRAIYLAILSLFTRPWIRRTWIRQEIFGARRLVVQCGSQQISWDQFIQAADLMKTIKTFLGDENHASDQEHAKIWRLLHDAQKNAETAFGGFKPPRDLLEVLLQSQDFEVTDSKDTFYAILGMCNITAAASVQAMTGQVRYQQDAVLVDYAKSKSVAAVYHDASLCILYRKGEPVNLAGLWHSYKRSPLHDTDVTFPSWAVDWRSGTFDGGYQATLNSALRLGTLQSPLSERSEEADGQAAAPNDVARVWHWPEPVELDVSVLRLRARVLNYVAHLTDFTCELDVFAAGESCRRSRIEWTARAIHCRRMQHEPGTNYSLVEPQSEWEEFDPQVHSWRLAILGVGRDSQLCLVPSTTQKGDLVIAIAPGVLATVISPTQGDRTVGGLIPRNDPYETITKRPVSIYESKQIAMSFFIIGSMAMAPLIIGFNIATILVNEDSLADTIVLACYGVTLTFSLVSNVAFNYFTMFEPDREHHSLLFRLVLVYLVGLSFKSALYFTTGQRQVIVAIFYVATMAILPINIFWELYVNINYEMEVALRREDVFEGLADVTQRLGHDYQLRGPILVESYDSIYYVWRLPMLLRIRGIRWCVFMVAMKVYNITKQRPALGRERFKWFLSEVCRVQPLENASPWDRAIQEFRLH